MAKATILKYKDKIQQAELEFLLIDSAYVADDAVRDLVGRSLVNQTLHDHSWRTEVRHPVLNDIVGVAKITHKNIMQSLREGKKLLMNKVGGYHIQNEADTDYELLETKQVEYNHKGLGLLTIFQY